VETLLEIRIQEEEPVSAKFSKAQLPRERLCEPLDNFIKYQNVKKDIPTFLFCN
jgi:flagellar biosynthesis chaperone FliJ